jgi:hypothetical protein
MLQQKPEVLHEGSKDGGGNPNWHAIRLRLS